MGANFIIVCVSVFSVFVSFGAFGLGNARSQYQVRAGSSLAKDTAIGPVGFVILVSRWFVTRRSVSSCNSHSAQYNMVGTCVKSSTPRYFTSAD